MFVMTLCHYASVGRSWLAT